MPNIPNEEDELDKILIKFRKASDKAAWYSRSNKYMVEALDEAIDSLLAREKSIRDQAILDFCQSLLTKNLKGSELNWSHIGGDVANEKFRLLNKGLIPAANTQVNKGEYGGKTN